MEEVLEKMSSAALDPESSVSEFEGLYKNWGRLGNQEERRRELLANQKQRRHNKLDDYRGIIDLVNAVDDSGIYEAKKVHYRPNIYVAGFTKVSPSYKNVLMLSEWLIEKPEDFMENWYVTPCPKGTRMLVVASRGITKCYSKYGRFQFQTYTHLPGGNPSSCRKKNVCCVLDCFYSKECNTFFVLDFLAWNNQPMTDCEFDFRNYWLQSQLVDLTLLHTVSKLNKIKFKLLPKTPCAPDRISYILTTYPYFKEGGPALDGLLFFHKKGHYVSGQTPLVGWLFPWMVPELLGEDISVHEIYMDDMPDDYVDQADFIKKFEIQQAQKKSRKSATKMDTATPEEPKKPEETKESIQEENCMDETPDDSVNQADLIKEFEIEHVQNNSPKAASKMDTAAPEEPKEPDETKKENNDD